MQQYVPLVSILFRYIPTHLIHSLLLLYQSHNLIARPELIVVLAFEQVDHRYL
jgi:hypothetical protein